MRKNKAILLLIIAVISITCNAQIRVDYCSHFIAGSLAGWSGAWTGWAITGADTPREKNISYGVGVLTSVVAGVGKELIYDKCMGRGTPEVKDALYTVAGGVAGAGLMRLILIGKKESVIFARKNYKGMTVRLWEAKVIY